MTSVEPGTNSLLMAATPALYARNAFRLTGLAVTASARETARYGDKLKLLHEVGGQAAASLPTMMGGTKAPEPDDLREALRTLKDPRSRLLHEFFWLWPEDWQNPNADEAFAAVQRQDLETATALWTSREAAEGGSCTASHNLAVLGHMRALDDSRQDVEAPLDAARRGHMHAEWKTALKRWQQIAEDDSLWNFFKARIIQIDDPAVTTGMAQRLRTDLPRALARINAALAVAYAEQQRRIESQWHITFLKFCHLVDEQTSHEAVDHALTKPRERLEQALHNAKQNTLAEETDGIRQARILLDAAAPLLGVLEQVHASHERRRDFESVSRQALDSAVQGYNKIYCSKNPSPAILAQREVRSHAEEYVRIMVRSRELTTDAGLHKIIDSNIQIANALLRSRPDSPYPPKQRPKWRTFIFECLRTVPLSLWVLGGIFAFFVILYNVPIDSSPSVGLFTPAELEALNNPLKQRELKEKNISFFLKEMGVQTPPAPPPSVKQKTLEAMLAEVPELFSDPPTNVFQSSPALPGDSSKVIIKAPQDTGQPNFRVTLTTKGGSGRSFILFVKDGKTAEVKLPPASYLVEYSWGVVWDATTAEFWDPQIRQSNELDLTNETSVTLEMTRMSNGTFVLLPAHKSTLYQP